MSEWHSKSGIFYVIDIIFTFILQLHTHCWIKFLIHTCIHLSLKWHFDKLCLPEMHRIARRHLFCHDFFPIFCCCWFPFLFYGYLDIYIHTISLLKMFLFCEKKKKTKNCHCACVYVCVPVCMYFLCIYKVIIPCWCRYLYI